MDISGKAAVVTGAGSGIGRAIALALGLKGARVVVADINEAGGKETVDLLGARVAVGVFRRCDVTCTEDLAAAFACCVEHFGSLDIVCNNAGINGGDLFADEAGDWRRVIDINLSAVIDGTRIAVREMRRRGGGVIVNTASMGGLLPIPGGPVYAASKAGVVNFTRSLAPIAAEGIRVNAVCPTYTDTPLVHREGDAEAEARLEGLKKMVGGILRPGDVAAGVIQLIEDDTRAGAIMRVTVPRGIDYAREVRPF